MMMKIEVNEFLFNRMKAFERKINANKSGEKIDNKELDIFINDSLQLCQFANEVKLDNVLVDEDLKAK